MRTLYSITIWLVIYIDKAKEDKAAVVDTLGTEAVDSGAHDALLHLGHKGFIGKGYGRYRTHAAGIEACVALAYTFVVLRYRQYAVCAGAVGKHEYRAFYTLEEFLDYNLCRSCAKLAVEHLVERTDSFVKVIDDKHALACCQAVGFEHIGGFEAAKEFAGLVDIGFGGGEVAGCGYIVTTHEIFGKVFRAFKRCAVCAGAYHWYAGA